MNLKKNVQNKNYYVMNALINSVQLLGRLGADPEVKTTNQGTKVCNTRLATNEYSKNPQGEWVETTFWHTLVLWGKLAEKVEQEAKKGTRLLVHGILTYREYTDTNNIRKEFTEIKVKQLLVLGQAKNGDVVISETVEES